MSVTTVSSSMITDATILNADIGAAAAIATTKLGAGAIVQVVNVSNSTYASGTTLMPNDATIPQKTEGDEYMTLAITPTHASNKLWIIWTMFEASTAGQCKYSALFQDTTANALASIANQEDGANNQLNSTGIHYMTAGTTSETTFKIRAGVNATDTYSFNGAAGGDRHSTSGGSSITIWEIKV
jgi:hypothetical protein